MTRRWESVAPLLVGALLALPTALAYYPPMTDLPSHEAVVGILRHWGDAAYFPPGLYELNLGQTNQLFHLLAWFFSLAFGTRWGVKLTIIFAQLAIFHAGARFADYTGRSRWGVLLIAPLALGFTYYWGFVANLLGYAGFLYALPLFDRAAQAPTGRRTVTGCVAFVLLYLAHGSVFTMALPVAAGLSFVHRLTARRRALALLPVAFGTLLMAAAWWRLSQLFTAGQPTNKTFFFPLREKVRTFAESFVGLDEATSQTLLVALAGIAAATLVLWRIEVNAQVKQDAKQDAEPADPAIVKAPDLPRWRRALIRYRFELLAATLIVGYLASPYNFRGAMFIHHRFLGPAWALLVLAAAPVALACGRRSLRSVIAKVLCAAFPIALVVAAIPQFRDSDRSHRDLDAVMDHLPSQAAVTFLSMDRGGASEGRAFDPSSGVARSVAQRGGRTGPTFTGSPICPIQIRRELRWDDYSYRLMSAGSRALVPAHDLDRFGWVLVRTRTADIAKILTRAFLPDAELVFSQGEWLLFRSTHTLAGLESAEPPLPAGAETIMARVLRRPATPR